MDVYTQILMIVVNADDHMTNTCDNTMPMNVCSRVQSFATITVNKNALYKRELGFMGGYLKLAKHS